MSLENGTDQMENTQMEEEREFRVKNIWGKKKTQQELWHHKKKQYKNNGHTKRKWEEEENREYIKNSLWEFPKHKGKKRITESKK